MPTSVAASGPGFVAIGRINGDPAIWASPDGTTWSLLPGDSLPNAAQVFSVTGGGPGFVAVGIGYEEKVEHDYTPVRPMVWTSPDGIDWSMVPGDEDAFGVPGFDGPMLHVTKGGPGLVAVGSAGWDSVTLEVGEARFLTRRVSRNAVVWTSPDGINWTRIPHDPEVFGDFGSGMSNVTVGGSGLVAVGEFEGSPAVWTSPDGITWSAHPHGKRMADVVAGGPGLVAVGRFCPGGDCREAHARVWTSPDGKTWTLVPYDEDVFGGPNDHQEMWAVVAVGDDLVAVGSSVWTSFDGVTWSKILVDPSFEMWSVVVGEDGLVAVGSADDNPAIWIAQPED